MDWNRSWRIDGMKAVSEQRGGAGRNWRHAAILLLLGGVAAGSFFRGVFTSTSGAALAGARTTLPLAGTRQVPSEYPTIQAAIDAAHFGERVLVSPGIYNERLLIEGKRISVQAALPNTVTLIGDGSVGPVVTVAGMAAMGTELEGMSCSGGIGNDGCGLKIDQAGVVVRNCEFMHNAGGGVVSFAADVAYYGCTFEGNEAKVAGGGVRAEGGSATLTNCIVRGNTAGTYGGGVYAHAGSATLVNSHVLDNATISGAWGGGVYSGAGTLMAINSVIERNGAVDAGGGVFIAGGEATLAGCEFRGNYSERGWSVGNAGGKVDIRDSRVCGMREWSTAGEGIDASGSSFATDCANDRNLNGRDDSEEIALGWSPDCDGNGVPDAYDPDCNGNGIVDRCEIDSGWTVDCNQNGIPDSCEIAMGLAADSDGDRKIDNCGN
jgi:hypothetical protein